jgi:SPP1 family predicted phage head-tail adaptor
VTFEEPSGEAVPDGDGGFIQAWAPLSPATWYVRIRPATARDVERATAGTVISHVSHLVHGRFHPGVTTKARMIANGRIYQITSAINLENRGREMELVADLQT